MPLVIHSLKLELDILLFWHSWSVFHDHVYFGAFSNENKGKMNYEI